MVQRSPMIRRSNGLIGNGMVCAYGITGIVCYNHMAHGVICMVSHVWSHMGWYCTYMRTHACRHACMDRESAHAASHIGTVTCRILVVRRGPASLEPPWRQPRPAPLAEPLPESLPEDFPPFPASSGGGECRPRAARGRSTRVP